MLIQFKTSGYATEANALKKVASLNLHQNIRYVIACQGGRYFPVVFLSAGQLSYARSLVDNNVYVIG